MSPAGEWPPGRRLQEMDILPPNFFPDPLATRKARPMTETLLQIANYLIESSGTLPVVPGDDLAFYLGYFENAYGERSPRSSGITVARPRRNNPRVIARKVLDVAMGDG
jgi:hypothetical protein